VRGFIGCDADLAEGAIVVTGHNLELRMVVIRLASEKEARASAEALGHSPLVVAPGERFYEVEVTTAPVGSSN
jgi:hypothetical protein